LAKCHGVDVFKLERFYRFFFEVILSGLVLVRGVFLFIWFLDYSKKHAFGDFEIYNVLIIKELCGCWQVFTLHH